MTSDSTLTAFAFPRNIEQKWDVLQGEVPLLLARQRAMGDVSALTAAPPEPPGREAYFEFPAQPQNVRAVRRAAGATAKHLGFDAAACDEIMLAVGEAVNNAVRYSAVPFDDDETACVRVWVLSSREVSNPGLYVTIVNPGAFTPKTKPSSEMPTAEAMVEGGRGFPLMSLLMDTVTVSQWHGQTIVRLWKALTLKLES